MEFTHDRDQHCYQAWEGGAVVGELHYRLADGVADFHHTSVPPEQEGKGIAGRLVQFALDDVRAADAWTVKATCPYVVRWLERHPDYVDLTSDRPQG
jgi:predicted GNAT family acetyltransferase